MYESLFGSSIRLERYDFNHSAFMKAHLNPQNIDSQGPTLVNEGSKREGVQQ